MAAWARGSAAWARGAGVRLGLQVRGVTSRDELHDDEPLTLRLEDVLEGDDVRVAPHAAEDLHLVRARVGAGARGQWSGSGLGLGLGVAKAEEDAHLAPHVRASLLDGLDGDGLAGDAVAAAGDDGEVAASQHLAHLVHILKAPAAHLQVTLLVGVGRCRHLRLSYFGQRVGRSRAAALGRCAWDRSPAERRQQRTRPDQQKRDSEQHSVVVQPAAPVGHPAAQHVGSVA
eukprot:scaffold93914_cov41-Phaeocystis_antarctica.AAC.2